jgi:hypothetical protein
MGVYKETPIFFIMKKILIIISFIILFIVFLNNYLSLKLWDYDFWWHIATGRYIWQNKALPEKDPFSFATNLEENRTPFSEKRTRFLLKQYWLSQVFLYKIYDTAKERGIIIFRATILILTLLLILWWYKKERIDFYISFPSIFLIYTASMSFLGERPVLFTLLFSVIVFVILEDFTKNRGASIYLLSPVMLIWSNLHGGYILGIAIISAYIVERAIAFILKKDEREKEFLIKTLKGSVLAIIASCINPNGINVFLLLFAPESRFFTSSIQEYFSPFALYKNHTRPIDWGYLFLIGLTFLVSIMRFKKMPLRYYILLGGLLFMSISALRFMIYYVAIGSMIVGKELSSILKELFEKKALLKDIALFVMLCSSVLLGLGYIDPEKITFQKASSFSVPEGAASFIKTNNIKGHIFSDMGSGGYLIWELYPENKIFIDTRALNGNVLLEYDWIISVTETLNPEGPKKGKEPLWKRLLNHYNINIIVLNSMDAMGSIPPLMLTLLDGEEWKPVYTSLSHVVFLRNIKENHKIIEKFKIKKETVYNILITRFSSFAISNPKNPNFMISLGEIFSRLQRYDDALKAYEYADKRLPGNQYLKNRIDQIKKKLKEEV